MVIDSNYKQLLLSNKQFPYKKILLENKNLCISANMYELSIYDFYDLLKCYLSIYYLENYRILEIEEQGIIKCWNLSVKESYYKILKEEIFKFAYLRCSKIGNSNFDRWEVDNCDLKTTIEISNKLANDGIFHTIYSSSDLKYNIKVSNEQIDEEELSKQYLLSMK